MMTNRRAIKRAREIIAECPHGGVCSQMQCARGVMWFSCPNYLGLEEGENGLLVKCKLNDKEE